MGAILAAQVEGFSDFMSWRMSRNLQCRADGLHGPHGALQGMPTPGHSEQYGFLRIEHDARSENVCGVGRLERLGIILEDFHYRLFLQVQAAKSPRAPLWGPTLGLGAVDTAEMARPPVALFRWRTHIYFQSQAFAVDRSHAITAVWGV